MHGHGGPGGYRGHGGPMHGGRPMHGGGPMHGGRPPMPPRRHFGHHGGCFPGCMMYVLGIGVIIAVVLSFIF